MAFVRKVIDRNHMADLKSNKATRNEESLNTQPEIRKESSAIPVKENETSHSMSFKNSETNVIFSLSNILETDDKSSTYSAENFDKENSSLSPEPSVRYETCGNLCSIQYFETDTMFIQDLYSFVYRRRRLEKSKPYEVYPFSNSPFTPALREACQVIMYNQEIEMFLTFAYETTYPPLSTIVFLNLLEKCIFVLAKKPFCPKSFLWMYLILCNHAALAFNRGIAIAPRAVMIYLQIFLSWLRTRGKFTDDTWKLIEAAGEDIKAELLRAGISLEDEMT